MSPAWRDLALHLDTARRASAPFRDGVTTRPLAQGWLSATPSLPPAEFPSASYDRVYWLAPTHPITQDDIAEAAEALRDLARPRAYIWLSPDAHTPALEQLLADAGASPWPYVHYIALTRPTATPVPQRPHPFIIRQLTPADLQHTLATAADWYSPASAASAITLAANNIASVWGAFENNTLRGLGLLQTTPGFAYLFAAATDPAHRARGIQSALIAARTAHAHSLNIPWATVETNTMAAESLRNLTRLGFTPAIDWKVYQWTL